MCLAVFMNTPVMAYAQEAESTNVTPRYSCISSYKVELSISSGTASISANLSGYSNVTDSYIKCNLEKLMGSYWMQLKSFTASGVTSASLSKSYSVDAGTYRVMGTFRCNTETITAYSSNVTY